MADLAITRLYEVMVVMYAVSLVFYFIDYLYKQPKIRRIAFWLISFVWLLQTLYFVFYIIEMQRFPILSLLEGILFYAWLLVSLSIVLHCIARVDLPVIFINVLGFIFVTIHSFAQTTTIATVSDTLISELLFIHICFAIVSYSAFTLSFVFSVFYLIVYKMLKKKKWSHLWSRLPSLQHTSMWMNISNLVGIPLLLVSLIIGFEWAIVTLDGISVFDVKISGSFILLILYSIILYFNHKGKLTGTTYAWVQIYVFLILVVNFFLGNKLSNFHLWL